MLKTSFSFAVIGISAVSAALFSSAANAEDYGAAQAYLHSFNNGVTVYSGVFALNKDLSLDTSMYLKYGVDLINPSFGDRGGDGGGGGDSVRALNNNVAAVSGASSAVSAGGSAASDTRHEITAGITHNFNNIIGVEAYYDYSHEKDYTSHTPTLTLKKDLFEKNTTLTLGYSRNIDSISGQFVTKTESRDTDNFFLGVTQVLTPFTLAQVGYARSQSRGFESEGIRLVPLNGATISSCTAKSATCVDEAFPSKRNRNGYIFGMNHYFLNGFTEALKRASVHLTLRYYKDDWDIKSYTAEVEYYKYLTEDLLMRLDYRYYTQTKAFFVKDTYTGTEEFKSSSPQLQKLNTNLAGVKLVYSFEKEKEYQGVQIGSIEGKYEYYTESIGVDAHIFMVGLRMIF